MRSFHGCKERLEALEEELDTPRQELEEKKKEESRRLKKVENLRKEIQVCGGLCVVLENRVLWVQIPPVAAHFSVISGSWSVDWGCFVGDRG